jgi:hypothetical protein
LSFVYSTLSDLAFPFQEKFENTINVGKWKIKNVGTVLYYNTNLI